ncbi:MAG: 5-(carboxyamino)imidazole ribonucleotide synthase, partial [Saprospiraceae bacterium]|nr:5-(carboxyamino)imidazole ribonucleotide synthase [Saprospiraceae bacterium]
AVCAEFTTGDFNNYDDVLAFGQDKDVLTIEIEHVNTQALRDLEQAGKKIFPAPALLDIIKDKGRQKAFYREHGIPTADFQLFKDEKALEKALEKGDWPYPLVQKTRTAGYDGRGVSVLRSAGDLPEKLLSGPCLAEHLVPVRTELAVIVARNERDEVAVYPPVEMDFHPEANLVEFLICPARVPALVAARAEALAERVIRAFDLYGLLAVEMFWTESGELLVNEVAPRPHNSGHHTIDSAATSQFQQHLRAICNLPLGDTQQLQPAVMVNLLGEPEHSGPVRYEGVEASLAIPGVHVHLYGKTVTSPYRKMGHVTVTAPRLETALENARRVKEILKVVS